MPRTVPAKPVEADVRLRDDRLQPVLGKLVLAEGAREEPAVVLPSLEVDDEGSLQLGLGEEQVRSFLYRVVLDRGAAPARIAASPLARSAGRRTGRQNDLAAVETLGEPGRRIRLHPADSQDREEEILRKPPAVPLGPEVLEEQLEPSVPRRRPSGRRRRSASRSPRRISESRIRGRGGSGRCSRSAPRRGGDPGGGRSSSA